MFPNVSIETQKSLHVIRTLFEVESGCFEKKIFKFLKCFLFCCWHGSYNLQGIEIVEQTFILIPRTTVFQRRHGVYSTGALTNV